MTKKFFLILILLTSFWAQNQNVKILNINVDGNQRLSDIDIIKISRLYQGKEIDMEDIQNGINNLWKLRQFQNIQILNENETDEGISLIIVVEELPTLDKISFIGNKLLKEKKLIKEIDVQIKQPISEFDIFEAMKKIKSLYTEENYHNVIVDTLITSGTTSQSIDLVFKITENKKQKILQVDIEGNKAFSTSKITRILKNSKPWKWFVPWRGKYNKQKFEDDLENLITYYNNQGYRDFYVISKSVTQTDDEKGLAINIVLHEGPKYYIKSISWEGNTIHDDKKLSAIFGFDIGDVFSSEKFQIAVSERVSPLYMDDGYFYFQIVPEITPTGEDSLDINFTIVENNKVKIRKIDITGNEKTHENVIRRELNVFPGETFNRKKIIDSYRDIIMLDYFGNVLPDVVPISEDEIDITIDVDEKSSDRANFSMGYNGTYGFTGGGGFEFKNFRGRGQTLSISYNRGLGGGTSSTSGVTPYYSGQNSTSSFQSFSIQFVEPWLMDTPNLVGASIYYSERGKGQGNYLPFDVHQTIASARWGRRFKWPDYLFRGTWIARTSYNRYYASSEDDLTSYSGFGNDIQKFIVEGNGEFYFPTSGVSLTQIITRDSRNHPEFPSSGSQFTWTSVYSGSILGGDEDYHKHEFEFHWFSPIISKLVMHQWMKAGAVKSISVADGERSIIPPNSKFFMGGSGIPYGEMLRGYDDFAVGPNSYSRPKGGNTMLKYCLELRFPFAENPTVYSLVFAEAGNVWDNFETIDPFDLKRSAGAGIRAYIQMLGMIGFDAGYGFDDINGDNQPEGWNYHILFGMPF